MGTQGGTYAAMLALTNPILGLEYIVHSGANAGQYKNYGDLGWVQTHDASGAALVNTLTGTNESVKNRVNNPDAAYVEATNSATWSAAERVKSIYITLIGDAATDSAAYGWVVFDSPNSAAAVLALADAGGAGVSVIKHPLKYNERNGPFECTTYFSRMDIDLTANGVMFVEAQ